ncbi:MAG: peptidylprolyl isomerase [Candidatus Marsarchaeota archaeon]|nr:peptidylprolyl isomerase [Candidatus Marsarchaeota archaeon]
MGFKKGDFVLIDFTAKVKETDEVFDTTDEKVAKTSGIYKENYPYEPVLIVLGEGWVVPGLEKALLSSEVSEKKSVEIIPKEAFGERDPAKVKVISERELLKRDIRPEPGRKLEVNGQTAVIRSVNAGRVQLDFNHPLSGRTIIYEFSVVRIVEGDLEKAVELVHRIAPSVKRESFNVALSGSEAHITIPEELLYWDSLQSFKITLVRDLIKYLDTIEAVVFSERFTYKLRKGEQAAKQTTEQAAAEAESAAAKAEPSASKA